MRVFHTLMLLAGFGMFAANGFFGREFFGARKRMEMTPGMRQSPGLFRTFFHSHGFRGGK